MTEVTSRFSDRVTDYMLYRPGYPSQIIDFLTQRCGLTQTSVIADIGSGTGKSSEMFLNNGNRVYGIEPNAPMRLAAEELFKDNPLFISMDTRAEATALTDSSIDFIIAGQAFHWFDIPSARKEFERILKPGGTVLLVWNERPVDQSGFMGDYDQFLKDYSTDYELIDHRQIDMDVIEKFFAPSEAHMKLFENYQLFDFTGLKGRYDSCSYAIPKNDDAYPQTLDAMHILFDTWQQNGAVKMEYETRLYFGKLK